MFSKDMKRSKWFRFCSVYLAGRTDIEKAASAIQFGSHQLINSRSDADESGNVRGMSVEQGLGKFTIWTKKW